MAGSLDSAAIDAVGMIQGQTSAGPVAITRSARGRPWMSSSL